MTSELTSAAPVNVDSGLTGRSSSVSRGTEVQREAGDGGRAREKNDAEPAVAWVNEVHYSNAGPDRNEVSSKCGVAVMFVGYHW